MAKEAQGFSRTIVKMTNESHPRDVTHVANWEAEPMLVYSEACERNKDPILRVLAEALRDCRHVLEIGSGTGQHAVHFARHLPHLVWQPSDLPANLPDLSERIRLEGSSNLRMPVILDVRSHPWSIERVDGVFSANTFHIMDWDSIEHFFRGVGQTLQPGGVLCVYGPFRYGGRYTSASNAAFDRELRVHDPDSGIRDFEAVNDLAQAQGLELVTDHAMPANNQTLVWRRQADRSGRRSDSAGHGQGSDVSGQHQVKGDRNRALQPAHLGLEGHRQHVAQEHDPGVDRREPAQPSAHRRGFDMEASRFARVVVADERHPHEEQELRGQQQRIRKQARIPLRPGGQPGGRVQAHVDLTEDAQQKQGLQHPQDQRLRAREAGAHGWASSAANIAR